MVSHCLNPACGSSFRYLYEGRIFNIERVVTCPGSAEPQRFVEHYWLCSMCCLSLKVVVENGRVTAVPIHLELTNGKGAPAQLLPVA